MRPSFCHGLIGLELAPVPARTARFSPMPMMIWNADNQTPATDQRDVGHVGTR